MIVPEYWAEARRTAQLGTKAINLHRFGWSNISPEDAQAMAEARVQEALARLRSGETLPRRELKLPYNGSEGVPIREEVLARHGEAVITRNAYGAHCLNTEQALFADIDFTSEFSLKSGLLGFALLNFLNLLLALQLRSSGIFLLCMLVSMPFSAAAARQVERLLVGLRGGRLHLARQRMLAFLSVHPDWSLRLYQTPAGLRVLATHRPLGARSEEARAFFRAVAADPIYVRMCLHQNCFRARLSAKPWRIGISNSMRPRPGVWPVSPEKLPIRSAWIEAYEAKAAGYAACRYLETLGTGQIHAELHDLVELHDRESGALRQDAPLA